MQTEIETYRQIYRQTEIQTYRDTAYQGGGEQISAALVFLVQSDRHILYATHRDINTDTRRQR